MGTVISSFLDGSNAPGELLAELARTPLQREVLPAPPEDPRPVAPSHYLEGLSGATEIEQWLKFANARGWRMDPDCLPSMLALAVRHYELRADMAHMLAPHAGWLTRLSPDWGFLSNRLEDWSKFAQHHHDEASWVSRQARIDPEATRAFVRQRWEQFEGESKGLALRGLTETLTLADEDWLESLLESKRSDVREQVNELLTRLTTSRLSQRQQQRLTLLGGPSQLVLPKSWKPEWGHDGMSKKSQWNEAPHPEWWLEQLVSGCPLDFWGSPDDALGTPQTHPCRQALVAGWRAAALRQQRPDWAWALLRAEPQSDGDRPLFCLLEPEQRWAYLERILGLPSYERTSEMPWDCLAVADGIPLSLARRLAREFEAQPSSRGRQSRAWTYFSHIAQIVPPELADSLPSQLSTPEGPYRRKLEEFIQIVRRRHWVQLKLR